MDNKNKKMKVCIMPAGCDGHVDQFRLLRTSMDEKCEFTAYPNLADVIIFFTCGFTIREIVEFYNNMLLIEKTKKEDAKVILCGCGIGAIPQDDLDSYEWVSCIVRDLEFAPIIAELLEMEASDRYFLEDYWGYIFICPSDGCKKDGGFCSFCKQYYLQIKLKSRYSIDEVCEIVKRHKRPIVMIGSLNTTNYGEDFGDGKPKLHKLLQAISAIPEVKWIILKCVAPSGMYPELEEELVNNPKVIYVQYYIQSGSDNMLNVMNVGTTVERNSRIIRRLKEKNKVVAGGVIVGHPGETKRDVIDTIRYIRKYDLWDQVVSRFIMTPKTLSYRLYSKKQLPRMVYETHCKVVEEAVMLMREEKLKKIAAEGFEGYVIMIDKEEDADQYDIGVMPFGFDGYCTVHTTELNLEFGDVVRVEGVEIKDINEKTLHGKIVEVIK